MFLTIRLVRVVREVEEIARDPGTTEAVGRENFRKEEWPVLSNATE